LRLPQCVHLVLGFELRDDLPGLHPISKFAAVLDEPAWYPKCQCDLVFRFNVARKRKWYPGFALLDRRCSDGARYRSSRFRFFLTRREQQRGGGYAQQHLHENSTEDRPTERCRHDPTPDKAQM
jgi:hypothetical protein